MSSVHVSSESAPGSPAVKRGEVRLEVVTLPVSDVDRAKAFYESLGWRLDIDLVVSDQARTVQITPPYSNCSIQFGKGGTTAEPGSAQELILAVPDIDAARDDLVSRGVDVSEVQEARPPGFEQAGRSYFARAKFSDPDGNRWVLQEITTRLPGRVTGAMFESPGDLEQALMRAEAAHGEHERRTGQADAEWPLWYARYMVAEQTGEALPT